MLNYIVLPYFNLIHTYNMLQSINENILVYMNSFTSNDIVANVVRFMADLPIFFLPIFLITAWLCICFNKGNSSVEKSKLLLMTYTPVLAVVINIIIQQFVHFSRPETALEWKTTLILSHIPDASFPSDHAAVWMAFATALFLAGYKKTAWIFLPFAIMMNVSRVMVWVHWPFDVLAGSIVWIASAFVIFRLFAELKLVKTVNAFIIKIAALLKL